MHISENAHIVDDEALIFDRSLEALQAVPRHVPRRGQYTC